MPEAADSRDNEKVLIAAKIADNVVKYHLLSTIFIMTVCIVTIPFMLIVVPIVWFFVDLHYKHLSCDLTETAVRVNKGVLNRVEKTIPLEKITDVAFFQGPIMRHLDIDGIRFETAGQSGPGALVRIVGVSNSRAFRDAVLRQKDTVLGRKDRSIEPVPSSTTAQAGAGSAELAEIRDILLRIENKLP